MVSWKHPLRFPGQSPASIDKQQGRKVIDRPEGKRRIRIDLEENVVYEHYSLRELSSEEYRSMWITAEDFMACKREYVAIVRLMMRTMDDFPESDECCSRGLEFKTKDGARKRKQTKQRAARAVLEEQEIQREEGVYDPEFLSDVYREISGPCSLAALNRGLKDQKVMMDLLDEDIREQRDLERFHHEPEASAHLTKSSSDKTATGTPTSTLDVPVRRHSLNGSLHGPEISRLPEMSRLPEISRLQVPVL